MASRAAVAVHPYQAGAAEGVDPPYQGVVVAVVVAVHLQNQEGVVGEVVVVDPHLGEEAVGAVGVHRLVAVVVLGDHLRPHRLTLR